MTPIRSLFSVLLLAVILVPATPAAADDEWEFDGGGWGHGVGLSQFGALGQAQEGRSAAQILQHYYTGASVVNSPLPSDHWLNKPEGLWVGLVPSTTIVSIQAVGGSVRICQPADCSDVDEQISPGQSWRYEVNPNNTLECRFRHVNVRNTGWKPCGGEVRQDPGTSIRVRLDGSEYARGTVRFVPSPTGFHAVLKIGLEHYLYGLAEVPSSWHSEALKVQAIIGRSYAVATALARGGSNGSGKLPSCGCHLRSTSSDQVYAGWSKEDPANGGNAWKAAVDATKGRVLTHPEGPGTYKIISTFYSSSNGGHSENVEFVWGGTAHPWLRSVSDPWSASPSINPLARWTVVVPSSKIKSAFNWDQVTGVEITSGPPGAVVRFTGSKGGSTVSTTRHGEALRLFLIANAHNPSGGQVRVSPYVIAVRFKGLFVDIAGNIFENAIVWLAQEGITQGCNPPTNNRYCPDRGVTRGEMAVFLARALKLPNASKDYFVDDNGKFYENAANKIAEAGITVGCNPPTNNRFCGERNVTRGEMAAFLARALSLPASSKNHFVDDNGHLFEGAINRIADAGITQGCNPPANDRYCPNQSVTRGQMAAFIKRAVG